MLIINDANKRACSCILKYARGVFVFVEDGCVIIYVADGYQEIRITSESWTTKVTCRDGDIVEGFRFMIQLLSQCNDTRIC